MYLSRGGVGSGIFSVAEYVSVPNQRDPEGTHPWRLGRAFSPHGLWGCWDSRGDAPDWYKVAPLALGEGISEWNSPWVRGCGRNIRIGCVGRLQPCDMECGNYGATPRNYASPGRRPGKWKKKNKGLKARPIHTSQSALRKTVAKGLHVCGRVGAWRTAFSGVHNRRQICMPGPCTPSIRMPSTSAVLDGPVANTT